MKVAIPGTQTEEQATFQVITQAAFNNLISLKKVTDSLDILADSTYTYYREQHSGKIIQLKIEKLPADVLKKVKYVVTDVQLPGNVIAMTV
ncbi:MAG: hypothetical protein ACI9TY_000081 [Alphaproteobacteria bacterium]|jgi:hypothetical protein